MYHGGTNFGFQAGANFGSTIQPTPTSYDYDSPISEAGDLTPKFFQIKKVIQKVSFRILSHIVLHCIFKYFPINDEQIESVKPKMRLDPVQLKFKATVFDLLPEESIHTVDPITFEQADFPYGFMLYSTQIQFHPNDPAVLKVQDLRDRAQVFVDRVSSPKFPLFRLTILFLGICRNSKSCTKHKSAATTCRKRKYHWTFGWESRKKFLFSSRRKQG